MKGILAFTVILALASAIHSDLEHLQLELKTRWEGLLAGLYQDQNYTVPADCFSSSTDYDDLFEAIMKFVDTRKPGDILSIYYHASRLLEQEMDTCGLRTIVLSYQLGNAENRFSLSRIANQLQSQKTDLAMHLFNAVNLYQDRNTLLSEDNYFAKTREQFMQIGLFINLLIGETHSHNEALLGATQQTTPLDFVSQLLTGLMKGLSKDGKTLGTCYDKIIEGINDIEDVGEMLFMVLHGQGGFDTYGMLFTKFYGHFNSAKNFCRVHVLAMHLADIATLKTKAVELQTKVTTVAASLGMQFMMKNYMAVGVSIGLLAKDFLDFYVE